MLLLNKTNQKLNYFSLIDNFNVVHQKYNSVKMK